MGERWTRRGFETDPVSLARGLLGHRLVSVTRGGTRTSGIIVETEAYLGEADRAAHSFGGRRTARTEAMFRSAGIAYVFHTYGMHHCFNVVCGAVDVPVAVLVRALEPVEGMALMRRRRSSSRRKSVLKVTDLCSGPAKLTQAMGITRRENLVDLCDSERVFIERGKGVAAGEIGVSARIGVAYAAEWACRELRFYVARSGHVSR